MDAASSARDAWIADRVQQLTGRMLTGRLVIVSDTTNFMGIDRDQIIALGGELFLVTGTERERRFGLAGEPKFWVKRAIDLRTGRRHILKLVFEETFRVHIGNLPIVCHRSAQKEGQVLELGLADIRFMQGRVVRDIVGNLVRVIDFIDGVDLLNRLITSSPDHQEYFTGWFPDFLTRIMTCFQAIGLLHDAGLCHGDIRNDHILVEQGSGEFRWIDFDLVQPDPTYDVWTMGNILHCVTGKGFVTFRETLLRRPDLVGRLRDEDASVFFPHRIMNLRAVFPYVPARLNDVLLRFSVGSRAPYDHVGQLLEDLGECLPDVRAIDGSGRQMTEG